MNLWVPYNDWNFVIYWGTVCSWRSFLLHGFSLFITQINTIVQVWSSVFYCPFFILEYHKVLSLVISTGVHMFDIWFDTTLLSLNSSINSFLWRTVHILTGLKVSCALLGSRPLHWNIFDGETGNPSVLSCKSHLASIKMNSVFYWGWKLIRSHPYKQGAPSDLSYLWLRCWGWFSVWSTQIRT